MKVLFMTKYGAKGASSRYRTLQYLPFLKERGIDCEVSFFFDDEYLVTKYCTGSSSLYRVGLSIIRRFRALLGVRKYALLVIEYELLPFFPALLERILKLLQVPYVLDFDDAQFHKYDRSRSAFIRFILEGKIPTIIRDAKKVIVGNSYLAEYASRFTEAVEIIPTVVDLRKYPSRPTSQESAGFTVGWIGSPVTLEYLDYILPALQRLFAMINGRLVLVGVSDNPLPGIPVETIPWSEEREIALLQEFDVGIMPLPDRDFERGKCGLKLIQYMSCYLPVVASPVGVNRELINHGKNGFLASTQNEWFNALECLYVNTELRKTMGFAGRAIVEESFSLVTHADRVFSILQEVGNPD